MFSDRIPVDATPNRWAHLLAERRAAGEPMLDLTESNPTRVSLPTEGLDAFATQAAGALERYDPDPRGARRAREAVAAYYADRGLAVAPEALVLTSSTSEAYAHLFRLLANPGESVLAPAPSYPLFEPLARLEGVEVRPWALEYHGRWNADVDSIERGLEAGARAVIVVQPNHPTGSCLTIAELRVIEALCVTYGAALISDEVFGDFAWDGEAAGLPSLFGDRRVPTFVLGGLSKACGLPQLKLSWIAACGPPAARDAALAGLEWIADLFLSVGAPAQLALPRVLERRGTFQRAVLARLAHNLSLVRACVARRPELSLLAAEGGWNAILRVPTRAGGEEWALQLLRRGVIVHPGHFYDIAGEAYLVMSLIVEPRTLAGALEVLEDLLRAG